MRVLKRSIWPYQVTINPNSELSQEKWLTQHMGKIRGRWMVFGYGINKISYYFRNEEDAIQFALRWS